MKDLFDYTAEQLRDDALNQVRLNADDWFMDAMFVIVRLESGWTGTGEDIRFVIREKLPPPHSQNVYGALIFNALRSGYIVRTGERRKMRGAKSHARTTDVYRRF
jgi:hypothetical protein